MTEQLSLLLADDEDIIRNRVCMMLGDRFRIQQASTARAAREAACSAYDAVLLDIVFPDGNGIDICREIKRQDPHATVIISSSMETVDAWDQAFQAGADGYLEKRELLGLDPRKIALTITNLVERNRLRRKAEELTKRQAELLSVLSHDVRAPFQALLGTVELLRKSPISQDVSQKVDTLHQYVQDQLSFINALLEILRLESGSGGVRPALLDVNVPVEASLQTVSILASAKEITVQKDLEPGLPKIHGDIARVAQLTNNLLTNAIKFTPRKGRIRVSTGRAVRNDLSGVELSVEDSGIGIRPKDLAKIFQRFHRGRDTGTEGETGTGLGLCICKEIVQLHGGTIEVNAGKTEGAVFTAWFPAAQQAVGSGASFRSDCTPASRKPVGQEFRFAQIDCPRGT
ncbi:MAG TPA: hybrid sensor histidine kinase/response regulator [Desulfomonilaceae bacterium]|nr:hybrid sensor histidine kinase/response regulator [Desulfomonilaceae bacterium]